MTAPGSGAEIIPFLKTWVNLPLAIAFTVGYAQVRPCTRGASPSQPWPRAPAWARLRPRPPAPALAVPSLG